MKILLVEDDLANQEVMQLLLLSLDYQVDVADNGLEALQALRRKAYDVVLMDIQMPEMDGLEATRCIVQEWLPSERPWIIALSADSTSAVQAACQVVGMDDYLSKPFELEKLVEALARMQTVKPRSD